MNSDKININRLTLNELKKYFIQIDEKPFRAKQVYEWLWKKNAISFKQMTNISIKTRAKLNEQFYLDKINIFHTTESKDKTLKIAFKLHDNEIIEGVLIPSGSRTTACISTQVGCPLNCTFCATGQMKYKRNLYHNEIVDQIIELNKFSLEKFNRTLSNIVIMGMGEPLLNYENVKNAITIITSTNGLGFSPQRITLSTIGMVKEIYQLADDQVRYNLAISLHSADNIKRSAIMPVNKSNPLDELARALKYFHLKTNCRITFEYLLLKDFNDTIKDAKKLADYCKIVPCKINIIEYNPIAGNRFQKALPENTRTFIEFLESKNLIVNLRKSKGKDIDAACGQLAVNIKI